MFMDKPIKVSFFINKTRVDKNGFSHIYCKLIDNNGSKKFSTGIKCIPSEWNKTSKEIKSKRDVYLDNQYLKLAKQKLDNLIFEYHLSNEPLTIEKLYSIYTGNDKQKYTLCDAFEFHNNHIAKQVGKAFKKSTLKRFASCWYKP